MDFTSLVGREKVHAGLVCLNVAPGFMNLEAQKRLFEYALDQLKEKGPTNEVLEVTLTTGQTVRVDRYLLSA